MGVELAEPVLWDCPIARESDRERARRVFRNAIPEIPEGKINRMAGEYTPPPPPPVPDFTQITTQASANPSEVKFVLGEDQDGLAIWTSAYFEPITRPESRVVLWIDDGTTVESVDCVLGQMYVYKASASNVALRIGATDLDGNGLSVPLTVCGLTVPESYGDYAAGQEETGDAPLDCVLPSDWVPETNRLTLPDHAEWFAVDLASIDLDLQALIYVKQRKEADGPWSPWQSVVLKPGAVTPIFAVYRYVALCCHTFESAALPVIAPEGSVIDESTPALEQDWDGEFNVQRVVEADSSDFAAKWSARQSGDKFLLAAGTYSVSISGDIGGDYWLCGSTGDPADVVFDNVNFQPTATGRRLHLSFLHVKATGSNQIRLVGGTQRNSHCLFERGGGSPTAGILDADSVNGSGDLRFFRCHAFGAASGAQDVWDGNNASATGNPAIHLIACKGQNAGSVSNDNLLTTHNGAAMIVWGGEFSEPGSGPAATADVDGSPLILVGAFLQPGESANAIRYGTGIAPIHFSYGCDVRGIGSAQGCIEVQRSIGNRYTCGDHNILFQAPANTRDATYRSIGDAWVKTGTTGQGTALWLSSRRYEVVGCNFDGFQRGWRIAGSDLDYAPQRVLCNRDNNGSGTDIGRAGQNQVMDVFFNVTTGNLSAGAATTPKNVRFDGNLGSGTFSSQVTSTSNRAAETPILNTPSTNPSNEDADGTPQSNSNMDWSTYASGLTSQQKIDLRAKVGVSLGLLGCKGDALLIDPAAVCRGPRQRAVVPSGAGLFQTKR